MSETTPAYLHGGAAPAPAATCPTLRPEVLAFAQAMETQLRANDYKPGWKDDNLPGEYLRHLRQEVNEFYAAVVHHGDPAAVLREAADVGNMAMIVADVVGALPLPTPDPLTALEREAIDFIHNVYSPLWSEMIQTRGSSPKVRQLFLDGTKPLRTAAWQHIKARAATETGT